MPDFMKVTLSKLLLPPALALVWAGWSPVALATLGGDRASVEGDGARMGAGAMRLRGSVAGTYTVHEATLPSGTQVREYLSTAGVVFGVAWSGPFKPDLRQLLGPHFDTMIARQAGHLHAGRPALRQQESDLVVESAGHTRNFIGHAYLPGALPPGVSPEDIQ
ncbi:MAG TPA: DUF2844 domain-containing protein [Burkholderiales bacterium]|nr:DUF2844 domain-containing protein [Burkholderiales bacterium]